MSALFTSPIRMLGLLIAAASLALLPSTTLAAKPTFHDHFSETFPANVCGIDVTIELNINQVFSLVFDESGNVVDAKITGQGSAVFTAANGQSVTLKFAGQYRLESVTVDPDTGFVTFVESSVGLPERHSAPGQRTLLRDAGLFTIATTLDVSGPEEVVVDSQIIVNHGPHPEAESDFTLFCEVFTEALS